MGLSGGKNHISGQQLQDAVKDARVEQRKQEVDYGSKIDFIATAAQKKQYAESKIKEKVQGVMAGIMRQKEADLDKALEDMDNLDLDDMKELHKKRLMEARKKVEDLKKWKSKNHGVVTCVTDQAEFFQHVKESKYVVCVFFKTANRWCDDLRANLKAIAPKHFETRFLEMEAEKAPYLCEKLNIYMMPTMILCKDNKVSMQCRGLDPINPTGKYTTLQLETRLLEWGFVEETVFDTIAADEVKAVESSDSDLDL